MAEGLYARFNFDQAFFYSNRDSDSSFQEKAGKSLPMSPGKAPTG
jgi:hypothetical protein